MSAAAGAIFFRDKPGLARAAKQGDWAEVRRLVYGGADPAGTARIAGIAEALAATPPPAGITRADLEALRVEARAQVARIEALLERMPA